MPAGRAAGGASLTTRHGAPATPRRPLLAVCVASAHVLVTSGDRRELWNATCVLFVVPAVWRTTSLDCCDHREQSSHCIARTSDAVAPLLVFITNASRGIVLAAPAAHTAADSTSRCPAPRTSLAKCGARSSRGRTLGTRRRLGRVSSAPDRRSHPAWLLAGPSGVGTRGALKSRSRLFDVSK